MKRYNVKMEYIVDSIKEPLCLIITTIGMILLIVGAAMSIINGDYLSYNKIYLPDDVKNIVLTHSISVIFAYSGLCFVICGILISLCLGISKYCDKQLDDYKEYIVSKGLEKDYKKYLINSQLAYDDDLDNWRSEFPELNIPFERESKIIR